MDWAELKKVINIQDGKVITADGEIVEGITAVKKPDSFIIETD